MCIHDFQAVSQQANHVCVKCGLFSTISQYSVEDARFEICIRGTFTKNQERFYLRKNHFTSLIYQLLGISNLHLPKRVVEIGKKAKNVQELRKLLKENKMSQYIPSSARILETCDPENFSCSQSTRCIIQKLLTLFVSVERAWDKLREKLAPTRKSFLSYNFILKKLCERIGKAEICRDLKPLKSSVVLKKMNFYWKEILKFLHWKPTEQWVNQTFPVYALKPNKWTLSAENVKVLKRQYQEDQTRSTVSKRQRCT
jgi:hypothetical protein